VTILAAVSGGGHELPVGWFGDPRRRLHAM